MSLETQLNLATEFTNREIGWLNFNLRVLSQAMDPRHPLLERLRFLGISNSNLDEFFMKRVGGLKRQVALGITKRSSDGRTPSEQLKDIRPHVMRMIQEQAKCFGEQLKPALAEQGVKFLKWSELSTREQEQARLYYQKNVFPVLTPLSVDPGHPFPFISNLSISLGLTLKHPDRDDRFFARVKIPQVLPQWVRLDVDSSSDYRFVSLTDLIRQFVHDLFPSMQVVGVMPFRLTRNADISRDEEDSEDLLTMIEEELRLRRFADVVRIEVGPNPDPWILRFLLDELDLTEDDVFELSGELTYTSMQMVCDLRISRLRFDRWTPMVPASFIHEEPNQIFTSIKQGDILIHSPYESFSASVEKFIRVATEDPKVLAIKMTLYRTGDNSPFVKALIKAAERGKQVVCLVELKARFDEERNIFWAQELESAGVHVVYGVVGLKTHAKVALVVRQEQEGLKSYCHIGTGNYNVSTSRLYTDLGILTCRDEIVSEVIELFNYLTGRSLKTDYQFLLVAPINMYSGFKNMIDRESENAKAGKPAAIFAKMNNMEENQLAKHLYQASQAGVDIDLSVRGFCCLRPGLPGKSEKIRVTSVVGRFLEHSRLFYFRNGAEKPIDGEFYLGSADWMYRNFHGRVECIVPIIDRSIKEKLWEIIQLYLNDQKQTWDMQSDGSYKLRGGGETGVQSALMNIARTRSNTIEEEPGDSGT